MHVSKASLVQIYGGVFVKDTGSFVLCHFSGEKNIQKVKCTLETQLARETCCLYQSLQAVGLTSVFCILIQAPHTR